MVARLAEQGDIDLATPVAKYWPEFAVHGKGTLTVGELLAHRAGLISPDTDLGLGEVLDSRGFAARLATQKLPLLSAVSFGHTGVGGQAGFADPRHRIGFGHLTNRLQPTSNVPRVVSALRGYSPETLTAESDSSERCDRWRRPAGSRRTGAPCRACSRSARTPS